MRTITERAGFVVLDEVGASFHVIKLGWTFQPKRYPGIAYEIVYALKKVKAPEGYTICLLPEGVRKIPAIIN